MMFSRLLAMSGVVVCLLLLPPAAVLAQNKALTIDAIYDPAARVDFSGSPPAGLTWLDAGHYLWPRSADGGRGRDWLRVEAATGRAEALFDASRMEAALASIEGVARNQASSIP